MKFSAEKASRKWSCGRFGRSVAAVVAVVAALLAIGTPVEAAAAAQKFPFWFLGSFANKTKPQTKPKHKAEASVPLPKPRPADAPAAAASSAGKQAPAGAEPGEQEAMPAAQPSACRLALSDSVAIAPSIPDIHGPGGCGGGDLVRLEAVVLPDKHLVSVKPAATLRCAMALEVAHWIRADIAPLASSLGSVVSELDNFDSFDCRGRNRVAGAILSEHGRANALDIRNVKFANGQSISLIDREAPHDWRDSARQSACARFSTVLGPGSDAYHEDHVHLDLMERRNNYKICQWNVWDPLPPIAPMLPPERPPEAPPREVAAAGPAVSKSDAAISAAAKSDGAGPKESETQESANKQPANKQPASKEPAKKRRQDRRF